MGITSYDYDRPWARQPFDTDLSWALFSDYLTLARPRSMRALVQRGAPLDLTELETLAMHDGWKTRARLYDEHLDRLRQDTIEHEIQETARDIAKRHAKAGRDMIRLGVLELNKLLKTSEEHPDMLGILNPRDLTRMILIGHRIERVVAGEATDIVESKIDFSGWSLEDLQALKALQEKAGGAGGG